MPRHVHDWQFRGSWQDGKGVWWNVYRCSGCGTEKKERA